MSKLLVIADDFTGSNDTGVQLAKKGAKVAVALSSEPLPCDVTIINTETRSESKEVAKRKIIDAIQQYNTPELAIIFKKIDSTFRGNIGSEIEAAHTAFPVPLIVVAAAIPATGRTTMNGECLVNDIPLLETEFSQDPKTPIYSSNIAEIIATQSSIQTQNIALESIRDQSFSSVLLEHNQRKSEDKKIFILDSETDEDLSIIANTLKQLEKPFILVGAAGIANQLPKEMFYTTSPEPVLILSGSMSITTQEQIDFSSRRGLQVIDIDAQDIWHNRNETLNNTVDKAMSHLAKKENCAIRTVKNQNERVRSQQFCDELGISKNEMAQSIASFLGMLSEIIINKTSLSGVLYTGGDIAIAAAKAINADGYIIQGEVEACIPYGHFINDSTRVVTKAGGFGSIESIENTIQFLQGKR